VAFRDKATNGSASKTCRLAGLDRKLKLTVVNDSGRKKMLTNVRSLTFSPNLVLALLSMTPLALKSYE